MAAGGLLGADSGPPPPGDALLAIGLISSGEFGITAPRAGQVYDLGFSPLMNTTSHAVTVLGFRVREASANVRVLGYRLYSADEFGAVVGTYPEGHPDGGADLDHAHQLRFPYTIPPHTESGRFAMARVQLTAFPPPGYVKGCEEIYRVGSEPRAYVQRFDCTYYFGEHAHDYFDGEATLDVDNEYRADARLIGCPICGSKGTPMAPGTMLGWGIGDHDPRGLTVVVGRRRVECRPPTGAAGRAYEALHGPDVYYEITNNGRCVVLK